MINKMLVCRQIPASYYFLLILSAFLEDGQKVVITKEKLIKASKILIEELDKKEIFKLACEVDINLRYKYDNLEVELNKFLVEYKDFVYLENNNIYLLDNIDYDKILNELKNIEEKEEFDSFAFEIRILRKKKSIKNLLGLNHIKELYRDLIKTESKIETVYLELQNNKNSKEIQAKIRELLVARNKIYKKLYQHGLNLIKAIQDEENCVAIDYKEDYQIDFDLLMKSEYYNEENDEVLEILENNFLSVFQIAIFGNISLSEPKLCNDLNQILCDFSSEDDILETIFYYENDVFKDSFDRNLATCFDSDIIYYLIYIKKLDELMMLYGYNLELDNVKTRLIYALDDISLGLYDENNREKVLEERLKSPDIDPIFFDNYDHFREESLFFIEDIFEGSKGGFSDILKKLAFVATYYELTKDEEIKRKLLNYTNIKHYLEYYRFIINSNSKRLIKQI